MFINSSVFTLIILVLAFSVWAFFKTRSRANVLFAGVCLCVLGYTCYPLLHTYLALRVQPWFSVEMLFYFLLFRQCFCWNMRSPGKSISGWYEGFLLQLWQVLWLHLPGFLQGEWRPQLFLMVFQRQQRC